MTTIKDIAEKLGLSSATVSRTLRNDESLAITPETRSRILTTAEEMGYVATRRRKASRNALSFLIIHKNSTFRNQIDSSYYFAVRSGIEFQCSKKHVLTTFVAFEELQDFHQHIDGILLIGNFEKKQYDAIMALYKTIPVTVVGLAAYYRNIIDQVSYRNYDSVYLALNHLLELGHKKIGYMGVVEASGIEMFGSRREAFIQIMRAHNLLKEEWIFEIDRGKDRVEQGYLLTKDIIAKSSGLPTAFFCANDPIALGSIKALTENNLRVPVDISIVAHDGSFPTQYSYPPLSTVDVHPYQLGVEGVSLLLSRIKEKGGPPKQLLLYPELVIRESAIPLR